MYHAELSASTSNPSSATLPVASQLQPAHDVGNDAISSHMTGPVNSELHEESSSLGAPTPETTSDNVQIPVAWLLGDGGICDGMDDDLGFQRNIAEFDLSFPDADEPIELWQL